MRIYRHERGFFKKGNVDTAARPLIHSCREKPHFKISYRFFDVACADCPELLPKVVPVNRPPVATPPSRPVGHGQQQGGPQSGGFRPRGPGLGGRAGGMRGAGAALPPWPAWGQALLSEGTGLDPMGPW